MKRFFYERMNGVAGPDYYIFDRLLGSKTDYEIVKTRAIALCWKVETAEAIVAALNAAVPE